MVGQPFVWQQLDGLSITIECGSKVLQESRVAEVCWSEIIDAFNKSSMHKPTVRLIISHDFE